MNRHVENNAWAPIRFGPGSSFSTLPPEAYGPGYTFGRCVAVPARCNGICCGECTADDEAREADRRAKRNSTP